MDEMDFAAPNPLISSILSSISQITGVIYTVIALSGGHAHNFMLEGSVLFIFSWLPPIYTEVHGSHDKDKLNTQRNVIAEIQHALLAINLGSLAGAARGEICCVWGLGARQIFNFCSFILFFSEESMAMRGTGP